jgi:hypothetical protein
MPTLSPDIARAAPGEWATAGDRQEAARQAYRRSVADGRPLTGVELGTRFDRSARWGTDRITEVRSEDISHSHGSHDGNEAAPIGNSNNRSIATSTGDTDAGVPIGNDGNGSAAASAAVPASKIGKGNSTNDPPLPIGNNRNSARPDRSSTASPSRRNGNRSADAASPRRSNGNGDGNGNGNGKTSPIGNNGNGNLAGRSAGDLAATPAVRRITTVAVLAVALVAGVASYDHQRVLAELAGEGWRAYLLPLSVDGLIVAASMSMLVRRRAGEPAGALAWCALLLGLAASLAANVVAADPELVDPVLVSRVVAAWPPIALGLSFELSIGQLRTANPRSSRR